MSDELHTCDICDGEFDREDMYTLGGDMWREGFAPEAFPAECWTCHDTLHPWGIG